MNAACQIISVSNALRPMTLRATLRTVSGEPPWPTPVMPASVSTSTTMLLWGSACAPLRSQPAGKNIRILVTLFTASLEAARAGAVAGACAVASTFSIHEGVVEAAAVSASDRANVLRSIFKVHLFPRLNGASLAGTEGEFNDR